MSTQDEPSRSAAGGPRPVTIEDLLAIAVITDAQIAPDGRHVAFALQRVDEARNENTSAIWLVATDGSAPPRQLTAGAHRDTTPRWSPDGRRLTFLSDRHAGKPQLYLLEHDAAGWGGEARRLTHLGRAVTEPVWSPDGRRLAFISTEGTGLPDTERERPGGPIRRITRRRYRFDGLGYLDDRFAHLWVVDVETGTAARLTSGDHDNLQPAWSPDGRRLAFVSSREREHHVWDRLRLHVIDVPAVVAQVEAAVPDPDGARPLGPDTLGAAWPAWSPDGAAVAYLGQRADAPGGSNGGVYVVAAAGGEARNLSAALDRSPGSGAFGDTWGGVGGPPLAWDADGRSVRFTACDEGRVSLFRADREGRVTLVIGGERSLSGVTASADGARLAFVAGTFTNPCDLLVCDRNGGGERRLTDVNRDALASLALVTPERFRFPSYDGGFAVDAWLIRPVGYTEGRRYPLVQLIHGGPHSVFGNTFFFDMQLWTSAGWHVLFVNPRASTGYGEAFGTANNGNWGDGDGREQHMALDLALERGGIDPERLAVCGLSYGGYMVNWLIGHTNRFRCAFSENSISNLLSNSLTSDLQLAHPDKDLKGDFWGNLDYYLRLSPITYAPNVRTPTLFMQSEADWRCPAEQGEQMYAALQIHGVPTEMVRFPGESHGFLRGGKPRARLERRRHMQRWLTRYLDRA